MQKLDVTGIVPQYWGSWEPIVDVGIKSKIVALTLISLQIRSSDDSLSVEKMEVKTCEWQSADFPA